MNRHFIRGIFDGDGCLTYKEEYKEWRWSICTTKECADSMSEIIKLETGYTIGVRPIKNGKNTYNLETGGNEKIYNICTWLYEDATICLDRKFEKALFLEEQQEDRNERIGRNYYNLKNANNIKRKKLREKI